MVASKTPKSSYYVGEEVRIEVHFGFERSFLDSALVQLFHRELDLPVQIVAPWIDALPGALPLDGTPRSAEGSAPPQMRLSFALNEGRADAYEIEAHSNARADFRMYAFERRFLPDRAGTLAIPPLAMRFAYATRFRESLLEGRVADERIEASVTGPPLELRILPLPEAGRPAEFTGAVGSFSVRAQADPRDLEAGESLKLELRIEGRGNFETLLPPRLDRLEGFHVYGAVEEKGPNGRTVTYDLAPANEAVKQVPAISFSFFDPEASEYRLAQTRAIPILVRPGAGRSGASEGSARFPR